MYDLPDSNIRRPLAGLQMGVLTVALWPLATPQIMTLAGLFFVIPFLAAFLRDWLVVSGVLDPDSGREAPPADP